MAYNEYNIPPIISHRLEVLEYNVQVSVNADVLLPGFNPKVNLKLLNEEISRCLRARLKTYIAAEQRKTYVSYPANWQESFKERWFPKWLKQKYPVQYKKIEVCFDVLYPDFKAILSEYQTYVHVHTFEGLEAK
jgi:hypothetical protein